MPEWFAQIPEVVLAAVLAALLTSSLTLLGVWAANRHSRMLQLTALQHHADQQDREREMALRRDVYLGAIESVTTAHNMLMRLADLDTPQRDFMDESRQVSSLIARVHIVGTNSTVQTVSALFQAWGPLFLELTLKRVPLIIRNNKLGQLAQSIDRSLAE